MIRFAALPLILLIVHQPATAQAPDTLEGSAVERAEEELAQLRRRLFATYWCQGFNDAAKRAACEGVFQRCTMADGDVSTDCVATRRGLSRDTLCPDTDTKGDRVACLEKRLDAMIERIADIERDLPGMIDERIKEALRPRVHKLDK